MKKCFNSRTTEKKILRVTTRKNNCLSDHKDVCCPTSHMTFTFSSHRNSSDFQDWADIKKKNDLECKCVTL